MDAPLEPEQQNDLSSKDVLLDELKNAFSRPEPSPPQQQQQVFMPFDQPQKDSYQWLYRDPSGNIQGPFSSQDMQEWYQSGYFDISLMVKRQGTPYFEPLASLVRNNPKTPFLTTSWPVDQQQQHQEQAIFQNNMMRPSLSTPINNRFLDAYPISPTEEKSNGFNMMNGKLNNFNFNPPPLQMSSVNSFNKNGFIPHMPMSPPNILPPSSMSAQTNRMFNPTSAFIPPRSTHTMNRSWSSGPYEPWELDPFDVNKQQQQELYNNKGVLNQQQIEQRYLEILRQNHQQSFQLQQRILQQQEMQRQYMLMKNDPSPNFDQNLPHPIINVPNRDSLFDDVNQITNNLSSFKLKEEDNGTAADSYKACKVLYIENGLIAIRNLIQHFSKSNNVGFNCIKAISTR